MITGKNLSKKNAASTFADGVEDATNKGGKAVDATVNAIESVGSIDSENTNSNTMTVSIVKENSPININILDNGNEVYFAEKQDTTVNVKDLYNFFC